MKSLVVHGSDDQVSPVAAGKHLHQSLKDSELITVAEASHQVFQEKPTEVGRIILAFMSKCMSK